MVGIRADEVDNESIRLGATHEQTVFRQEPRPPVSLHRQNSTDRFAVIDFETTGLSPNHGDRAIEIGVVMLENHRVVDTYQSLINPRMPLPAFITSFTGITNAMVADAPFAEDVLPAALAFVGNARLVAHNASFDKRFWCAEIDRIGRRSEHAFLCTMLLARRLYPWAPNHKLGTLAELHQIIASGRHHRALADAEMTAELLSRMQRDLRGLYLEEPVSAAFLDRYQRIKRAVARSLPQSHHPWPASGG
jgi:DNA polymerase III subunit epsilon